MDDVNAVGELSPRFREPPDGARSRWLPVLPPTVDSVTPPHAFSPSHVAIADECLLRAVLGSVRPVTPLPAHPAADLGTAFHLLLERAVRGRIARQGSPDSDVRCELDAILSEANAHFVARMPPGLPGDLWDVWPPLEWRRKVRAVLDAAAGHLGPHAPNVVSHAEHVGPMPPGVSSDAAASPDFAALPPRGRWAEVRMAAPELRLRGRADLVEKSPEGVTIRDLKTGRVVAGDGALRPHVARQLRLYGLMAMSQTPSTPVRLVVDDGAHREVPFGPPEVAEVTQWLQAVVAPAAAGVPAIAAELATVGRACDGCGFRHACPRYRDEVPLLWAAGSTHRLPLDIWGRVEHVEHTAGGTVRLRLEDAARRTVAVSGLSAERMSGLSAGAPLHLFGLRTRDRAGGDVWRHPRNFHESAVGDPRDRAWALQCFTSPADA